MLAFATSVGTPFFLDDSEAIERNPHIRALSPLSAALAAPPQSAVSGRPLVSLSLALNHAVGGLTPTGYHLGNLAVHIACALLLWGIVRRTLRASPAAGPVAGSAEAIALAVALVWGVHPLHTEVIAYVVARTESLMALCYLLTLYGAARGIEAGGSARWLALAVGACLLGATAKESIVTTPLMVLLYDVTFGAGSVRSALQRRGGFHAALLASWLVLAALHWDTPRFRSAGFATGLSAWDYLLTQAPMLVDYLRLAVWPAPLVADYGVTEPTTASAAAPFAIAILLLAGVTLWLWRRQRALAYLATWWFVTLAPSSSVVPIATEIGAERRMYLPLVALVVLAVLGVRALARAAAPGLARPATAGALTAAVTVVLAAVSAARGLDYRDPVRVWQSVVDARPHGRAQHNLGIVLAAQGRQDEALARYRLAAETLPDARYSLGFLLATRGEDTAAAAELREFLVRKPDDAQAPRAAYLLVIVLARQGDLRGAVAAFGRAQSLPPPAPDARRSLAEAFTALGASLEAQGRLGEASEAFAQSIAAAPDAPGVHLNLGTILMQQGHTAEGEQAFRRGVAVAPAHAPLRNALAAALATRGALAEAADEFNRVLALEPGNAEAQAGLRVLQRPRDPTSRR
jgi:tetratricopeptide (TPR) repeat protein